MNPAGLRTLGKAKVVAVAVAAALAATAESNSPGRRRVPNYLYCEIQLFSLWSKHYMIKTSYFRNRAEPNQAKPNQAEMKRNEKKRLQGR